MLALLFKQITYIFAKIDSFIDSLSKFLLVVCLFSMLFFSLATIVCRWMSVTIIWFDPLIKHLVFLSTFLGGVLATGRNQHIGIDLLSKYFSLGRIIYSASFFTLCWLIKSSIQFVKDSFLYEGIVFLGIHRGYLTSLIPFGLTLLAIRSFYGILDPNGHKHIEGSH